MGKRRGAKVWICAAGEGNFWRRGEGHDAWRCAMMPATGAHAPLEHDDKGDGGVATRLQKEDGPEDEEG